ncbi:quinone oxidoreductase [Gammaproteobacteria bacterium]|nr:quinone oxidoreductase [Gammaproteobacteria bacterium]
MSHAIKIYQTGGPDEMRWEPVEIGDPGPGEIRLRHSAVGLNFIDVYFRTGTYPPPQLPFTPGLEGAGIVEAVGDGVEGFTEGDRVAYAAQPIGAYAEVRLIPAEKLVHLPAGIEERTAAAMMLKGMTAQYLLRSTVPLNGGDTILFHAAAGGVGLIACQWARHLGVTIIGTVGSDEKAELATAHGCTHTIVYTRENFADRVQELTDGVGVDVVYDSVGQHTFEGSLDCLKRRGTLALFGQSSGKVSSFDPSVLAAKGSLYLTRPTLFHYTADRSSLEHCAGELFQVMQSGAVQADINQEYALSDASLAHTDLEGRRTTGASILLP